MESGNLRNLDQIQEAEPGRHGARVGPLVLASVSGALVVFAVIALVRRPSSDPAPKSDPLAALAKAAASTKVTDELVAPSEVAFPQMLSDDPNPSAAMVAVAKRGKNKPGEAVPGQVPSAPPPAGDRLPVVPLPAQTFLTNEAVVERPKDRLTAMAAKASRADGEEVEPGTPGGVQLQVSSFRRRKRAEKFARSLRRRGHHAYVESAHVPGKGVWYRVRIGPFKNKYQASRYRREFERREHIVTFIVEPDKKRNARARRH